MKRVKKGWAVLLCLCMAVAFLPIPAFAADTAADTWDGTADTDWYKAEETVFDIASAEALAGVSKLAANGETFEGITLRLTRDIDLAGLAWDPIKNFCGIFDGENHKISNMHVEREEGQSGFFEYLNGAQVKNLVLEDAQVVMPDTNSSFYQGVLAGWATTGSEIINCGASGSITADASGSDVPSVSGFIGSCKGDTKLASCWSTVDVETTDSEMACMAGGLVGQWENAANGAQIIDSYFGGSVTVAEATTSAGGILGAGLSFNGNVVLIKGCVSYGSLSTPQNNANAVQIGALDEYGQAEDCLWLDNGQPGVIRLIVDWDTGTAEADPEFDETKCGDKVKEFDEKILSALNSKAQTEGLWTLGINGYPVFSSQTDRIQADYSAVEGAKSKIPADLSLYTDETVKVLNDLLAHVDYQLSKDEQATVDEYAAAIETAVSKLQFKAADYSKVEAAIEKAKALNKDEYTDFSKVEAAVSAVVYGKNITEQSMVDAMAAAIENEISALEKKPAPMPSKPEEPSESSRPEGNPDSGTADAPQTGDSSNMMVWIAVMLMAGAGMTVSTVYSRKRKHSR